MKMKKTLITFSIIREGGGVLYNYKYLRVCPKSSAIIFL